MEFRINLAEVENLSKRERYERAVEYAKTFEPEVEESTYEQSADAAKEGLHLDGEKIKNIGSTILFYSEMVAGFVVAILCSISFYGGYLLVQYPPPKPPEPVIVAEQGANHPAKPKPKPISPIEKKIDPFSDFQSVDNISLNGANVARPMAQGDLFSEDKVDSVQRVVIKPGVLDLTPPVAVPEEPEVDVNAVESIPVYDFSPPKPPPPPPPPPPVVIVKPPPPPPVYDLRFSKLSSDEYNKLARYASKYGVKPNVVKHVVDSYDVWNVYVADSAGQYRVDGSLVRLEKTYNNKEDALRYADRTNGPQTQVYVKKEHKEDVVYDVSASGLLESNYRGLVDSSGLGSKVSVKKIVRE